MSSPSIFWHDYETWGANPQKDHPCQFAGIRTDFELNIIGKPVNLFCQIPNDQLPHPQACLITGITPQQSIRDGLIEAEFIAKVLGELSQPETCVAGYNSVRFDDEVTRYTLYRNFHDPYAREWQNGNSRWDIIDMVRACYALRPNGIEWPLNDEGVPSFKLEALCKANNIVHEDAHDAMSDVYATISLAKLIKDKQPKLYHYLFALRQKAQVLEQIDCFNMTPFVHVSSRIPAINGCCTWMAPIALHPTNKNAIICLNLAVSPEPLFALTVEQLTEKLYMRSEDLEPGEHRLPIKLIHVNKCPVVAPAKTLDEENALRLGIDRKTCLQNLAKIKSQHGLQQKLQQIYEQPREDKELDVDHALYTGGFFSRHDRNQMDRIISTSAENLVDTDWQFDDARLKTMLFRYRARNYPSTLHDEEIERWQRHRQFNFLDPDSMASIKMPEYLQIIEQLSQQHMNDPNKKAILTALLQYAENL